MIILFEIIYIYIRPMVLKIFRNYLQNILGSLTQIWTYLVKRVKGCGTSKVHGIQWPPFSFESYNANKFSWKCRIENIIADSDLSSNSQSFGTRKLFKKSNNFFLIFEKFWKLFFENFEFFKFKVLKFTKGRKRVCEILICTQNIKKFPSFLTGLPPSL